MLPAPLQVAHDAWHGRQTPSTEALAKRPSGVHDATHEAGGLRYGVDEAQLMHSVADGPSQRLQEKWHLLHVSAAVELPPLHVKPGSMVVQSALQPSPAT